MTWRMLLGWVWRDDVQASPRQDRRVQGYAWDAIAPWLWRNRPMILTLTADDLSERALQLLRENRDTSRPIVIEHEGTRLGVLISPEEYERVRKETIERGWEAIQRVRELNAGEDPDEVLAFITEVVEEVRQELYDQRQQGVHGGR